MKRTPRSARRRASKQLAANVPGLRASGPYSSKMCSGSFLKISHFRNRRLHPVGHLVLGDPAWTAGSSVASYSIWCSSRRRSSILRRPAEETPGGILQIENRFGPGAELNALVNRGQEPIAPEARVKWLIDGSLADEHAEGGQVLIGRAQTVAEPGPHRGPPGDL